LSCFLIVMISFVMVGCSKDNKSKADPDEKVTLQWLVPSIDQPDQDKAWAAFNEKLKEYLPNTTVEFENVTIPEYAQRWQLVAAGREPIDIAWSFWSTPLVQEVQKGAYMDLTD